MPVPIGFSHQELTRPVKRGKLNPNGWVSDIFEIFPKAVLRLNLTPPIGSFQ